MCRLCPDLPRSNTLRQWGAGAQGSLRLRGQWCDLLGSTVCRRGSGMTLVETLLAMAVLVMVAAALAGLSNAVQMHSQHVEGCGLATQHARVALARIERTVREATANESFPGFLVIEEYVASWRFPDTLVIWHPPAGKSAADPKGLPRFSELVLYYPNPQQPSQLVEATLPGYDQPVPPVDNPGAWASAIAGIKKSSSTQLVVLTDRLRTCYVSNSASGASRGAVRFESRLRPSAEQWNAYRAGTLPWAKLPWVQGMGGSRTGLRQAWLRIELQLVSQAARGSGGLEVATAIPFFGSAAVYYEMHR